MNVLIIINDASYGTEKAYNALRLAMTFLKEHKDVKLNVFLIADAVTCAIPKQETPDGYYNLERMLEFILKKGANVMVCGSCIDARGMKNLQLIKGIKRSTMSQLTQWSYDADKIITF